MKKLFSVLMTFFIVCNAVFCLPLLANAKEQPAANEAMYKVSSKVYADAYMLINLDDASFPVIAAKNKDKKKYPASLTKIVTAIVTINNVKDLQAKTVVSKEAILALSGTGAQVAGLKPGEELTIETLLYLTMVHSACDACQVLAEYVAGSVEQFVAMMNDWAKSVGCTNTNFVNPDGLHDDNHYTTAQDMALITLAAIQNETFNQIACTKTYDYGKYTFIHTNFMLDKFHVTYYYPYAEGIKTGSTTEAGYCVITKAAKDGYNYLAVVMDAPIKKLKGYDTKCSFIDAASLFDWAFDSLKYATVIRQNDLVSEVAVNDGKDADTVQLVAEKDVTTLVPTALDASAVMMKPIDQRESLDAPITKGEKICTAEIIYAGQVIAKTNLVAAKTVELSTFLKIINALKKFFTNKIVIAVIVLAILLLILYVVMFIMRLKKDKKRIAEKRRRQRELDEQLGNYGGTDYIPPPKR